MVSITVKAIVDDDHQLTILLPDDMPTGPVEVTVTPLPAATQLPHAGDTLTREQARAIMAAAGVLSTVHYAPPGTQPLSEEEREEFGRLAANSPDTLQIINEGRGPR